jgi:8-oxo-dGTP diphosphatase
VTATDTSPRHSVSVAAVIVDDRGRFLAIRRADNGRWEPPGGVLELNESIEEGLAREVHEETGLRVKPVALTGVYKNMRRGIVALVFRCQVLSETARTTGETDEVRWLTPEQVGRQMDEAYRVRLLDALSPESPHVRTHDGVNLIAS